MKNRLLSDYLKEQLRNPEFAAEYLNAFIEEGTPEEIAEAMAAILAVRNSSEAKGSFEPVVKQIQEFMHNTGLRWSAQPMV